MDEIDALSILTPLEKSIVGILYLFPYAVTTKRIADGFLKNLHGYFYEIDDCDKIKGTYDTISGALYLVPYYEDNDVRDKMTKGSEAKKIICSFKELSGQREVHLIKKQLSHVGITSPSFESVRKGCESLEKSGVLFSRDPGNEKTKVLWALNPIVRASIREKKREFFYNDYSK